MGIHLQSELNRLNIMIKEFINYVEDTLEKSITAYLQKDSQKSRQIIKDDSILDQMEIDIEEECLKMLALYQPVATDLRFIIAILKMNNDLERVGDLASNIARACLNLSRLDCNDPPIDLETMMKKTKKLFKKSHQSLVKLDTEKAEEVIKKDQRIDDIHSENYQKILEYICNNHDKLHADYCLNFLSVSGCLERIGDHATNIAEDVIYMIEGKIVRH